MPWLVRKNGPNARTGSMFEVSITTTRNYEGFEGSLGSQVRGIPELHLVIPDKQVDRVPRAPLDGNAVITGELQFR
jgi:hypothetical protein